MNVASKTYNNYLYLYILLKRKLFYLKGITLYLD